MAKAKSVLNGTDELVDLLKRMWITQLGLAGVPQQSIRKIVGGDITRVTALVRHLKRSG
jgi:hypothetical protein